MSDKVQAGIRAAEVRPNPGSDEAVEQGCTCPRMDNGYGKGSAELRSGEFWITQGCPVHDRGEGAA